ncbi:MAG: LbtU family siderophore porin [Arenicella sp.]
MNLQKQLSKTAVAIALGTMSVTLSANDQQTQKVETLEQRINYLEKVVQDQNNTLKEHGKSAAPTIAFSGAIEVEAGYSKPENGDSETDLTIATVELVAEAQMTEQLSAEMVFLYEDDSDVEVDVAQFTYALKNLPLSFTLGQTYVPFGSFETGLISDPLNLEIGETREISAVVAYENHGLNAAFYIFNGDNDENGESKINNWGTAAGYSNDTFSLGVSYINALGESDGIQEALSTSSVGEYTDGLSVNGLLNLGPVTLIAEHTTALDSFGAALDNAEPSATNVEVDFNTAFFGKSAIFAAAYQTTDDALVLELPESRVLVGLGVDINDHFSVGVEYARDSDYDVNDGGTGEDSNAFTVQFAASL